MPTPFPDRLKELVAEHGTSISRLYDDAIWEGDGPKPSKAQLDKSMRDPEDQLADAADAVRRGRDRVRHLWRRSPPGQVQQGVARRPRVFQVVLFVAVVIGLAAFAAQLAGH